MLLTSEHGLLQDFPAVTILDAPTRSALRDLRSCSIDRLAHRMRSFLLGYLILTITDQMVCTTDCLIMILTTMYLELPV